MLHRSWWLMAMAVLVIAMCATPVLSFGATGEDSPAAAAVAATPAATVAAPAAPVTTNATANATATVTTIATTNATAIATTNATATATPTAAPAAPKKLTKKELRAAARKARRAAKKAANQAKKATKKAKKLAKKAKKADQKGKKKAGTKAAKKAKKAAKKAKKAVKKAKKLAKKAAKKTKKAKKASKKSKKSKKAKTAKKGKKFGKLTGKRLRRALQIVGRRAAKKARSQGMTKAQVQAFVRAQQRKFLSRHQPKSAKSITDKDLQKLLGSVQKKQSRQAISKLQKALKDKQAGSVVVPIGHHQITIHPRTPRAAKVKQHKPSPTDKNYVRHLEQTKKAWSKRIEQLQSNIHAITEGKPAEVHDWDIVYSTLDPPDAGKAAAAQELLTDLKPFLKDAVTIKQAVLDEGRERLVDAEAFRWTVHDQLTKAQGTPLLPAEYRFIE